MTSDDRSASEASPVHFLERTKALLRAAQIVAGRIGHPSDELAEMVRIAENLKDELTREEPSAERNREILKTLDYLSGWLEEIDATGGEPEAGLLGRPAHGAGRRRAALKQLEAAREELLRHRSAAAEDLARQALELDPSLVDARLVPAEIEIARGRDEEAARKLFHITEIAREQLDARQRENAFLKDKPFSLAFDFFQDSDAKAYGCALELLAQTLFRLRRYEDAHRVCGDLVAIDPGGTMFATELRAVAAHLAGYLDEAAHFYDGMGNHPLARLGRGLLEKAKGNELDASVLIQQLCLEYPTLGDFLLTGGEGQHWARALDPERHLEVQGLVGFQPLWSGEKAWIQQVLRSPRNREDFATLEELASRYGKARTDSLKREIAREFERLRNPVRLRTRALSGVARKESS